MRPADPVRLWLARESPADIAAVYRAHGFRLLWVANGRVRPDAETLVSRLEAAEDDGFAPARYDVAGLRRVVSAAASGRPLDLARAELSLSQAAAAYLVDLHRPSPDAAVAFRDPALPAPPATAQAALARVFDDGFPAAARMHPIYEALRAELARRDDDDPLRPQLLANLDRARVLPADPGPRYVLVDTAAQALWLYEDGQVVDSMKVVVGTPRDPTPVMAGLIRYANYQPYWNVPVDVVREEIAPHVLREGVGYLERQDMEVLSDWTPNAYPIDPTTIDWAAVHAGGQDLRVRQRPGAGNILGRVKLMLPNGLGIYLHDTPGKYAFARNQRTLSHGCVRLEDAERLARRLIGPAAETPPAGDDARLDLPQPVPVYIVYFTLASQEGALARRPDIYRRDPPRIARVGAGA